MSRSGLQIFINYRRADTRHVAGRLRDFIQARCDACVVFMDVEDIEPGLDYVTALNRAVGSSDVLLVLIGEQWLAARDATGARRIDDPDDRLRIEIEAGLTNRTRVIPVLVDGASMPRFADLPPSLAQLARHHAIRVSHESFRRDAADLLATVRKVASEGHEDGEGRTRRVARWLAGGLLLLATLALVALRSPAGEIVAATRPGVPPEGPWGSLVWSLPAVPCVLATWLSWSRSHLGIALGCVAAAMLWIAVSLTHVLWKDADAGVGEHVALLVLMLAGLVALLTAVPAARRLPAPNRPVPALLALAVLLVAVVLRVRSLPIAAVLTSTKIAPTDWSRLLDRPSFWISLLIPLLVGLPAVVLAFNQMQVRAVATLAMLQVVYPVVLRSISFPRDTANSPVALVVVNGIIFVLGSLCILLAVQAGQRTGGRTSLHRM